MRYFSSMVSKSVGVCEIVWEMEIKERKKKLLIWHYNNISQAGVLFMLVLLEVLTFYFTALQYVFLLPLYLFFLPQFEYVVKTTHAIEEGVKWEDDKKI